jgi:signal transduction histidine kinase
MQRAKRAGLAQQRLLSTLEGLLAIPATTVKDALDAASQIVAEAMGADKVDVFLYEAAAETLVALGTSATPMGRRQHAIGLDRLALANGGRCVAVFQAGLPFRCGHTETDVEELRGVKEALGVRSTLAAPIAVAGTRRGVFCIVSAQPEAFAEEDLRFCEAAARWAGLILHRAELTERLAREAAEQARRMAADELIEMLAHDLRTPLTPAKAYLYLLRREVQQADRPQAIRYAAQVDLALERIQHMIDAILETSRLEQGVFALVLQPVDLATVVQDVVTTLSTPQRPVHLVAPPTLVVERADPERLRQALENLIGNALQHTLDGVPVAVAVTAEARAEGTWALVTVRDEGPGIPPMLLPTLFERFARGPASAGLGLGLYLARGIAQAHGGTLTVHSALGAGTTFQLALPLDTPAS